MKSIGRETLLNRIPQEYKLFIPREKELFTALDVLNLEGISDELKISVVEIPGFIHSDILNEFACRCAERALSRVKNPDPRSVAAIEAKRAWMKGEISDAELAAAWDAAWAAVWAAAREHALYSSSAVLRAGALAAHGVAYYMNDAEYIATECADMAIWAALEAAGEHSEGFAGDSDRYAAMDAACFAEQAWQVEELKKLLKEGQA